MNFRTGYICTTGNAKTFPIQDHRHPIISSAHVLLMLDPTHIYILCFRVRSLINRPNGRRWARTPFPAPVAAAWTPSSFYHSLSPSFSSFNIPFPCIVPVLENICIFHSVLFYFVFFFLFWNDLSSDRNKTRHVRPPCPKGLKRDRVRVSSTTIRVHFETFLHHRCCCCCCRCCMCNVVDKQCIIINGSHGTL